MTERDPFLRDLYASNGDELTTFLTDQQEQRSFNLPHSTEFYKRAVRLDQLFRLFANAGVLHIEAEQSCLFLFYRAHSAFLTSVGLALSGQLPEAYMVMRGCLEGGLYALQIKLQPSLAEIWLKRDESEKARRAARKLFSLRRAFRCLLDKQPQIAPAVRQLYETTIKYGAHPNVGAIFVNIGFVQGDYGPKPALFYFCDPRLPFFEGTLRRVMRVGVVTLKIFDCVFRDEFAQLGLGEDLMEFDVELEQAEKRRLSHYSRG